MVYAIWLYLVKKSETNHGSIYTNLKAEETNWEMFCDFFSRISRFTYPYQRTYWITIDQTGFKGSLLGGLFYSSLLLLSHEQNHPKFCQLRV